MNYIRFDLKTLDFKQLFQTKSGKSRKCDHLLKFYLAGLFYTFHGRRPINRRIKRAICQKLRIKPPTFWRNVRLLQSIGLVCKFKLRINYKPGKNRRAVTHHRHFLKAGGKYLKIPVLDQIFHPDFDIRGYITGVAKAKLHPKQKFTFPATSRATAWRAKTRQKAGFSDVSYLDRDTSKVLEVKITSHVQNFEKPTEVRLIELIHFKKGSDKPEIKHTPWIKTKLINHCGNKYLASAGILYTPVKPGRWISGIMKICPKTKPEVQYFLPDSRTAELNKPQFTPEELQKAKENSPLAVLHKSMENQSPDELNRAYERLGLKRNRQHSDDNPL